MPLRVVSSTPRKTRAYIPDERFGPDSPARLTILGAGGNERLSENALTARQAVERILMRAENSKRWWLDIEGGPTIRTFRDARSLLDNWGKRGAH